MKTSNKFKKDIEKCYFGKISFDKLIKENKSTLEKISNYYYYKYQNVLRLLDWDDIYQLVCMWMFDSFLRFDHSKGVYIYKYVMYNIGARIKCEITKERMTKRGVNKIVLTIDETISREIGKKYINTLFEDVFIDLISVKR
jgi:DNA-directed RNA polymerase specialized sigma subunit